jgi:hypothetical protein
LERADGACKRTVDLRSVLAFRIQDFAPQERMLEMEKPAHLTALKKSYHRMRRIASSRTCAAV